MGVFGERLEITNTIETGAGLEAVRKGQRREHGVTTGTATTNQTALWIDLALLAECADSLLGVLDIGDSPGSGQRLAIAATKAGAAAIVNIHNGKAATGPVLQFKIKLLSVAPVGPP